MKEETLAKKARKRLSGHLLPKKREKEAFKGNLGVTASKINRRRRLLEEVMED